MSIGAIINLSILFPIFGIAIVVVILVLIGKRVRDKRKETFEKRDN